MHRVRLLAGPGYPRTRMSISDHRTWNGPRAAALSAFAALCVVACCIAAGAPPAERSRAERLIERAVGAPIWLTFPLIILATFISEDMTCISVGLLAARGDMRLSTGMLGCFLGLWVGDVMLYWAGRLLGRPFLKRAPIRWLMSEADVDRCSAWLEERGAIAVFLGRFLPGSRLPTYFAAGLLKTNFPKFALYFFLAVSVWVPLLVGTARIVGEPVMSYLKHIRQHPVISVLTGLLIFLVLYKIVLPLLSRRGRRRLAGAWNRIVQWEFWPWWFLYIPVFGWIILLAVRHRSLTVFTAANPGMPHGGFVGESKYEIMQRVAAACDCAARTHLVRPAEDPEQAFREAKEFMASNGLDYPVVLKPDVGQRGFRVRVVRSDEEMRDYLRSNPRRTLVQEYVPGVEFGIFYVRYPGEDRGRIFSITEKRPPVLVGDGWHNIEQLILRDNRAVCLANVYIEANASRLYQVPRLGELVQLVEIGNHARGCIFLDGARLRTRALEDAIDGISKRIEGFHFGRYDLRTPSEKDLMEGRNFKIIELNGVTSEATHIYDPQYGLGTAYRTLFRQWKMAFEIGALNRRRGVRPTPLPALLRQILRHFFGRREGV